MGPFFVLGPYNLQGLGLVLLLPTILMLGIIRDMPTEVIVTLLGGVTGYIFGQGDDKPGPGPGKSGPKG